ncbi:T9SS type A sorting domain-containing protein [Phaeocystidibacter luteus]|uniref:T9SS type A sorting domain-containing protein n=1 Tax=Phaeocystidibacter luteus TaxID=911197 RepID=A0A6N6RJ10_9FLAO|nr:T9SS type A sorting domain-containing protein [Phaeocystidibacter luteus]KAB2805441.1 T9SS type A sorting domain-containing protein [Phaeocystidibacter luteus]
MRNSLRWCMALLAMIAFSPMAFSQAYVITPSATDAGNPGGVRTSGDFTTTGGTSIWTGAQAAQSWSAAQALPFAFDFYGSPVTHYIVASNGLLSFDTTNAGAAVNTALNTNGSLPDANLPDKTVAYFWEDFTGVTSSSDDVYAIVEGTAPNRQLWILNYSMKVGSLSYGYWALVLEETTNKIYVMDMNYFFGSPHTATVGIQVDGTTSYQTSNSPNEAFNSGGSGNADNEYYEFTYYGAGAVIPPVNVTVTPGSSTATINYDLGTATGGEIEYGSPGFVQGAGTTVTMSTTTAHTLTGLSPATSYEFYVRSSSGGNFSSWVGPYSFITTCVTVNSFPYLENFDGSTWSSTTTYDPCWNITQSSTYRWQVNSGGTGSGSTGPTSDASGVGQYIYTEASSGGTGSFAWAEMPPMDLTSLTQPELTFMYHMYGATIDRLDIEASLDSGTTWMVVDSIVGQQQTSNGSAWEAAIVDLDSVNSAYTLIRFSATRGTSFTGDISLDEVRIRQTPPCPDPTGFASSDLTPTSVNITFIGAGATSIVEWGPQGYGGGTGTTVSAMNDTVPVTGLPPGTCLDFYIQSDCTGAGNGVSTVQGPFTICTPCNAAAMPYQETFDVWPLDCEDPAVGTSPWINDGGWAEAQNWSFNNADFIMDMQDVVISVDARVVFDWSHQYNASYPDDDLAILSRPSDSTTWDTLWYGKGVSFDSQDGAGPTSKGSGVNEIVLLPSHYTGQTAQFQINVHSDWGPNTYINDFTVEAVPACLEPIGFSTLNIQPDSVFFTFTADTTASSYAIEWGPCGYAQGTGMTDTIYNDSAGLGGLMAATCYDLYIQTFCSPSGQSIWAGPFSFFTACDTLPLPWTEDFENAAVPAHPVCWDLETSNSFYVNTVTGTSGSNPGANSGTNYLLHRYSFNNEWWSFTPEFNLQAGQSYQVSFWYQTEGTTAFDEVRLAFGPGQTSADMTYQITSQTGVSSTTYTQFVATFIPPQSGIYHIGLMTRTSGFSGAMNIDDWNLQLDPSPCPNVSSLASQIVSENEVDLVWGGTSAHTSFDVEWGPVGFVVGTGAGNQYYGLTSPTLNLDTLSPNTCYEFYVRADCGSGPGAWVGPVQWCTPCAAINTYPYTEDFDGNTWGLTSTYDPCWEVTAANGYTWLLDNNSTGSGNTGPTGDVSGSGNYIYSEASSGAVGSEALLQSVAFDLTVLTTPELNFYYHMYGATIGTLYVDASMDNGQTWMAIDSIVGQQQTSTNDPWAKRITAIPSSVVGSRTTFRWRASRGTSFTGDISVDEVTVQEQPTCPQPLFLTPMSESTTTLSFYFNPGGAANFNVAYGPAATTPTPGAGTWVNATNDTVTLTGLTPATLYNIWVRDSCGAGDVSLWTGPISMQTLCVPYTTPFIEGFGAWPPTCWDVNAGTQTWTSFNGWAQAQNWSFNGADFLMNTPQVILSDSSELSFKWSHQYNSFYPDAGYVRVRNVNSMVWDTLWSREGTAFESNDGAGATSPGSGVTEFISIPNYGAGDTIIVQFWSASAWGPNWYVDDVSIYDRPACAAPSNFNFVMSTATTADLYWTAGSAGAAGWVVEVGAPGFQPGGGTATIVSNDTTTITGLMGNTDYCAYLTELCPGGADSSTTIGPVCFRTACVPYGIPYSEDFSGSPLDPCWSTSNTANNISANAFWKLTDVAWPNYGAQGQTDHTGNGGYAVGVDASVPNDASMDSVLLFSPYIDITGQTSLELSFHMFSDASQYTNPRNVFTVAGWTGTSWVNMYTWQGDSSVWFEVKIPLSGYGLADTTRFMFHVDKSASGTFYNDILIDDIFVQVPPTCPTLGPVSFTNPTMTGSTATWDTTASPQTYQIEYGPVGFTPGSGTLISVPTNTHTFTGLPNNNVVQEMYIRPICSGNDTGYWSGPTIIEKMAQPCDDFEDYSIGTLGDASYLVLPWAGDGGDAEIVSQGGSQAMHIYDSGPAGFADVVAVFDTMTSGTHNISFDFQLGTGAGGYYNILHNYTGIANVWAIEVYVDANGTATVNQGTNGTGVLGTYTINTTGWNTIEHVIDLDNDTAYIVVNGTTTTVGWQFSLGSVNQADRFNAVNFYSAANAGQTPNYYVDNFCVCSVPGMVMASNTTCTTIEVDWTSSQSTSTLEYGPAGFTPGSGTMVNTAAPYTITGLTANTAYDIYVGDECNGDTLYNMFSETTANGPLPSVNPTATQDSVNLTAGYYSFNSGAANADSVSWSFSDGSVMSGDPVSKMFSSNGYDTVYVTAYNDCGSTTQAFGFLVVGISVEESAFGSSLNIFPNPSTGVITLSFELGNQAEVSVNVVNALGQHIMEIELGDVNSYEGQIDLSHLPKGVYILQVNADAATVTQRVTLH